MTDTHELRISHMDLRIMAIGCLNCGGEVVGNFADSRQGRLGHPDTGLSCAVCHSKFDEKTKEALVQFRRFIAAAGEAESVITFRVPMLDQGLRKETLPNA